MVIWFRNQSGSRVITCTCSEAISSAFCSISSRVSQTITSPKSAQALPAISAVGRILSCRSISAMVACASASLSVSSTAGEVRPCSAWPSRSTAQISPSTESSAMTRVSVGPANRSMPTRPNS
ncbi:hypothetical protein D3C85_1623650 [compost metagenome]